jgi:hypothetical protein
MVRGGACGRNVCAVSFQNGERIEGPDLAALSTAYVPLRGHCVRGLAGSGKPSRSIDVKVSHRLCFCKPARGLADARAGCGGYGVRWVGGWPQSGAAAILLTDFKSLLGEAHGTALHCRSGLRDRKKLVIVSDVLRRPEPRLDPRSEPRPRLQPGGVPLPREGTPLSCSRAPRVRVLFRPELEEWFQERVPR